MEERNKPRPTPRNELPQPWDIDQIDPQIRVFGHGLPQLEPEGHEISSLIQKISQGKFLATNQVILIVHGFYSDIDTEWLSDMKDAILSINKERTVILVGWGKGCDHLLEYPEAAANTQTVGKWLGSLVLKIREKKGGVLHIWGIGHSLGAHVLGMAGRHSGDTSSFNRITGLDPAGPSFERVNQENRLRPSDARNMVDVIHTDGYDSPYDPLDWFSPVNHFGTLIPLGTLDFYPNGGLHQPGVGEFTIGGNHHRAIDLFIWSVSNPGKFTTTQELVRAPKFEEPVTETKTTEPAAEMGYYANAAGHRLTGHFYLKTTDKPPWAPCPPESWCTLL